MKRILNVAVLSFLALNVSAQDIHFSQFFMAPLNINPALAGAYRGDYRANLNFKEQYSSFNNAYRTINGSFDKALIKDRYGRKETGAGINVYQDVAGDSKTKNFNISLNISQTVRIDQRSDLSLGLGLGYTQYSANLVGLTWDNQFNGLTYDERLSSRENNLFTNQQFFDLSTGILYRSFDFNGYPLELGLSAFHLTTPNISFGNGIDNIPVRLVLHGKKEFDLSLDRWGAIPTFFIARQGPASEITLGGLLRYDAGLHSKYTGYHKKTTLYFGLLYRHLDALIPQIMIRYQEKYNLGISYDVNISQLRAASRSQGGFEISLSISGFFQDRFQVASPLSF